MSIRTSATYRAFALVGGLSWTFVICVVLCAFLGTFVDNTFRTPPLFLLIGVVIGVIVGLWQSWRMLAREIPKDEPKPNGDK